MTIFLQKWQQVERKIWRIYALTTLAIGLLMLVFSPIISLAFYFMGAAVFALEFKLIILLGGILARTICANYLAIALLFIGKLGIWLGLAAAPFWLPKGMGKPFALGAGVFIITLILFLAIQGEFPKLERLEK